MSDAALAKAMAQINERGYSEKYKGSSGSTISGAGAPMSAKTIYQAAFAFLGRDEIEMKYIQNNSSNGEAKHKRLDAYGQTFDFLSKTCISCIINKNYYVTKTMCNRADN